MEILILYYNFGLWILSKRVDFRGILNLDVYTLAGSRTDLIFLKRSPGCLLNGLNIQKLFCQRDKIVYCFQDENLIWRFDTVWIVKTVVEVCTDIHWWIDDEYIHKLEACKRLIFYEKSGSDTGSPHLSLSISLSLSVYILIFVIHIFDIACQLS